MPSRIDVEAVEARSRVAHTRRPGRATAAGIVLVLALTLLATRMVAHPVGAARTDSKFNGKAVTTATVALSALNTSALIARTYNEGNAFGSYAGLVAGDAEDSVGGLQGTFDSIQPPSTNADHLADELDQILSPAAEHTRSVRITIRRSDSVDSALLHELADDAAKLTAFSVEHS